VRFRLSGGAAPVEGRLERTVSYARVGRGARAAVKHDHASIWLEARLPAGAAALRADVLQGERAGPLRVTVFPDRLPAAAAWALAVAAVLVAAAAEARLRPGTNAAAVAGIAVGYGLLFAANATPDAAAGPAVGSLVLGLLLGAAGGGLAALLARRVLGSPAGREARGGARVS